MSIFDEVNAEPVTRKIARAVCGYGQPKDGWKAKIFAAAEEGARQGMGAALVHLEEVRRLANTDIDLARLCAVEILSARLVRALPEKRDMLRARVAAIRSGQGDALPEVAAALLALERRAPPQGV